MRNLVLVARLGETTSRAPFISVPNHPLKISSYTQVVSIRGVPEDCPSEKTLAPPGYECIRPGQTVTYIQLTGN